MKMKGAMSGGTIATGILMAKNFPGDVADACCVNPSIYDTFTHKPGDWWPSTGGEFPGLQGVFEDYTASGEALPDDYAGPTYWKIPQMLYPNHTDLEPWQLNARTYNADSYDHWLEVFAYAGESDDELETFEPDHVDEPAALSSRDLACGAVATCAGNYRREIHEHPHRVWRHFVHDGEARDAAGALRARHRDGTSSTSHLHS